jgi:hypothetical protein
MRLAVAHPLLHPLVSAAALLRRARLQAAWSCTIRGCPGFFLQLISKSDDASCKRRPRPPQDSENPAATALFAQLCCTREGGADQGSQWPLAVKEWPTHTHSNSREPAPPFCQRDFNRPLRHRKHRNEPAEVLQTFLVPLKRPTTHAHVVRPPYDSAIIKYLRFDCDIIKGVLRRFGEAAHLFISRRSVATGVTNSFANADFARSSEGIICSRATPNRRNVAMLTPLC